MRIILLTWLAAGVPAQSLTGQEQAQSKPDATYQSILAEYNIEYGALSREARSVTETEARNAIRAKMSALTAPYAARFLDYATAHPDADDAAQALVWFASRIRDPQQVDPVLDAMIRKHADDAAVAEFATRSLTYSQSSKADALLSVVLDKATTKTLKGKACYALATRVGRRAGQEGNLEMVAEAKKLFEQALNEYGNAAAQRDLDELAKLGIGNLAPEIEAEDIDGQVFKLSDYRGKVVMIDFWGDW